MMAGLYAETPAGPPGKVRTVPQLQRVIDEDGVSNERRAAAAV